MNPGYFSFAQIPSGKSKILLIKKIAESSTGSHLALWENFESLLDYFQTTITLSQNLPSTDRADVIRFISKMRLSLKSGRQKASWLTEFRNNVNYRFSDELWFHIKNESAKLTRISL